jgi:hypothetical protein
VLATEFQGKPQAVQETVFGNFPIRPPVGVGLGVGWRRAARGATTIRTKALVIATAVGVGVGDGIGVGVGVGKSGDPAAFDLPKKSSNLSIFL